MPNDFEHTKWFHFEDGSNPYGILGGRQDLFFKMVVSWQPEMINNSTFKCPEKPTEAYYHPVISVQKSRTGGVCQRVATSTKQYIVIIRRPYMVASIL